LLKRAPNVEFWCQKFPIPGVELGVATMATPFIDLTYPGEHMKFDELEIVFKVDDNLENYLELFNWITALGKPDSFKEYAKIYAEPQMSGLGISCDITALIVDAKRNVNMEIVFTDAFITALSGITFDSTLEDIVYINAAARFSYQRYYIHRVV
jgi:hypothetical protein